MINNPVQEIKDYIDILESKIKESCQKDPLGTSALTQYYISMLKQARTTYVSMLTMNHEKNTLGYVRTFLKDLEVEISQEIKWIESSITFKPKDGIGQVVWLAEFCRKCEESIFSNEITTTPLYQSKLNWCKKTLSSCLCIKEEPDSNTGEVFERLFRGNGFNVINKNWLYLNILLPMYPKWHEVSQTDMLSTYSLKEITQRLNDK